MSKRRILWLFIGVLFATISLGCHYWPRQTNDPPASPCPTPNVDSARWREIAVPECGVRLRLPQRYDDGGSYPMGNDWFEHIYRRRFDSVIIFFTREGDATLRNKTIRPGDYEGYADCTETIAGHIAVISSYRDSASIAGRKRHFRPYVAEARWQLSVREFLRIEASTADRRAQEEVIAAFRTVQFVPRSFPLPAKQPSAFIEYVQLVTSLPVPLTAYLLVIGGGGYLLFRCKAHELPITTRRRRAYIAAYFALVLTPSMLTDFFLFAAPAPALLGFFALLPSVFYVDVWPTAYAISLLYILPILISFIIFYFGLTLYARRRSRRASQD